jgi:hypothetical protein
MSKKPRTESTPPTEAEMASKSISGLTLDNLEDRVEKLRQASEPTRKARAATNKASRDALAEKQKAKNREIKKR